MKVFDAHHYSVGTRHEIDCDLDIEMAEFFTECLKKRVEDLLKEDRFEEALDALVDYGKMKNALKDAYERIELEKKLENEDEPEEEPEEGKEE